MTGYHTRRVLPAESSEASTFGEAIYDVRSALGLTIADLTARLGVSDDDIGCIEEGHTASTVALLRSIAAAFNADARLAASHNADSVSFETPAA